MKKIILMVVTLISLNSFGGSGNWSTESTDMHRWINNTNGTSPIWELHLVKGTGRYNHTKYRCSQLYKCWEAYEAVRVNTNNFASVDKVWMEIYNSQIKIIK
jgi:hypothetical protein